MSHRHRQLKRKRYYAQKDYESYNPPCWCGVSNPYYAPLTGTCGGLGMVQCYCGGDQCVCHWHGETECFGCPDCDSHDGEPDFTLDDLEYSEEYE